MKLFLLLSTLLFSGLIFASEKNRCEDQYVTYCECTGSGSYSVKLISLNLKTDREKTHRIGSTRYSGHGAKESCLREMDQISICR